MKFINMLSFVSGCEVCGTEISCENHVVTLTYNKEEIHRSPEDEIEQADAFMCGWVSAKGGKLS